MDTQEYINETVNERLDKLFPTLQRVEFDLQVSFEKEEDWT